MDKDFYKARARQMREMASEADPFIKKRLLRLAGNYDAMVVGPSRATETFLSGPSDDRGSLSEIERGPGE